VFILSLLLLLSSLPRGVFFFLTFVYGGCEDVVALKKKKKHIKNTSKEHT
jgi:hypothetical protein